METLGADHELLGKIWCERYQILELIGRGGMGTVYKARQLQIDREVALKVIHRRLSADGTQVQRFEQEARASSKLSHPNNIRIFDYGKSPDGRLFMAMELLKGQTLADLLAEHTVLPPERVVHVVRQIFKSLAEAHQVGLVHRDLKPENIFVCEIYGEADFIKVLDYGIAKAIGFEQDQANLTQTGFICGTPRYISPEQALGQEVDGRSDLYSVGVLMYEMLCGRPPFLGENPISIVMKHVYDDPPPLVGLEGAGPLGLRLVRLVEYLLEKNPARRPPNAERVIEFLNGKVAEKELVGREVRPHRRKATDSLPTFDEATAQLQTPVGPPAVPPSPPPLPSTAPNARYEIDPGNETALLPGVTGVISGLGIDTDHDLDKTLDASATAVIPRLKKVTNPPRPPRPPPFNHDRIDPSAHTVPPPTPQAALQDNDTDEGATMVMELGSETRRMTHGEFDSALEEYQRRKGKRPGLPGQGRRESNPALKTGRVPRVDGPGTTARRGGQKTPTWALVVSAIAILVILGSVGVALFAGGDDAPDERAAVPVDVDKPSEQPTVDKDPAAEPASGEVDKDELAKPAAEAAKVADKAPAQDAPKDPAVAESSPDKPVDKPVDKPAEETPTPPEEEVLDLGALEPDPPGVDAGRVVGRAIAKVEPPEAPPEPKAELPAPKDVVDAGAAKKETAVVAPQPKPKPQKKKTPAFNPF